MNDLQLPSKGFTIQEKQWLKLLLEELRTVKGVQGRNISITNTDHGQVIDATDSPPCP